MRRPYHLRLSSLLGGFLSLSVASQLGCADSSTPIELQPDAAQPDAQTIVSWEVSQENLTFPPRDVHDFELNDNAYTETLTLTNTGSGPSTFAVGLVNDADFAIDSDCDTSVPAGNVCTIEVISRAQRVGETTSAVTVNQVVATELFGMGTARLRVDLVEYGTVRSQTVGAQYYCDNRDESSSTCIETLDRSSLTLRAEGDGARQLRFERWGDSCGTPPCNLQCIDSSEPECTVDLNDPSFLSMADGSTFNLSVYFEIDE